jgi:hypothetical protein
MKYYPERLPNHCSSSLSLGSTRIEPSEKTIVGTLLIP